MATVNKDFRIKSGLVVEGANATVNGEDIITTGSSTDNLPEGANNLYFTEARAAAAVADEISTAVSTAVNALTTTDIEEGTNLYFTNQRALDATASAYDAAGAAATAENNAKSYADGLAVNYDPAGSATTAENNAKAYADGLAVNYDAAGAATTAENNAKSYADGVALTAENNAKSYADGLAVNYDAAGAAATAQTAAQVYADGVALTAETNAKSYADSLASNYDVAGAATTALNDAKAYTDQEVAALVDGAPALLDTLNELAAAIADNPNYATDVANLVAGKQDTLTAGANIDITGTTISVTGLDSTDISDFNTAALSATASAYDAAGAAATAEQNAKNYADLNFVNVTDLPGQLDDYVPLTQKGVANGVATLDANGFVPAAQLDIDVTGDISTAINALTTDDIEEGSTNLYFTDARAVDAITTETIYPPAVVINNLSKQVAATQTVGMIATVNGLTWAKSEYKSAKLTVKAKTASHTQLSEVLVTLDGSDNVAITEYGIVYTDTELAVVSADVSGSDVRIRVTTVNPSTDVTVVGTLLV